MGTTSQQFREMHGVLVLALLNGKRTKVRTTSLFNIGLLFTIVLNLQPAEVTPLSSDSDSLLIGPQVKVILVI